MRKFIISDIHGFGNVYYSMMSYLDNISNDEEIELYINGDLIDRGYESAEILLDIKKRIEDNKYKITYLGGNHELMMYEVFKRRKKGLEASNHTYWYNIGGGVTDWGLYDALNDLSEVKDLLNFVANLKIYHKFVETIKGKPIVLVHAACPEHIRSNNIRIKDDNEKVYYAVCTREREIYNVCGIEIADSKEKRVGNNKYFTIVGHTAVDNKYGVEYHPNQNYLNIDGGCGYYVSGRFSYNHFPLVEVCDGFLKILTFDSNNEIIYGNYFAGDKLIPYEKNELEEAKKYLNRDVKIKKLAINEDGVVYYQN